MIKNSMIEYDKYVHIFKILIKIVIDFIEKNLNFLLSPLL